MIINRNGYTFELETRDSYQTFTMFSASGTKHASIRIRRSLDSPSMAFISRLEYRELGYGKFLLEELSSVLLNFGFNLLIAPVNAEKVNLQTAMVDIGFSVQKNWTSAATGRELGLYIKHITASDIRPASDVSVGPRESSVTDADVFRVRD